MIFNCSYASQNFVIDRCFEYKQLCYLLQFSNTKKAETVNYEILRSDAGDYEECHIL